MRNVLVVIFYSLFALFIIGGLAAHPIQDRESNIPDQFKGVLIGDIKVDGETITNTNIGAEGIERPNWVTNLPENKNGIIYFRGYAESNDEGDAESSAKMDFVLKMQEDGVLYPIPESSTSRYTANINRFTDTEAISVRAIFSDLKTIDMWMDSNEGIYVLCSCSGVEILDIKAKKTIEELVNEMDLMELLELYQTIIDSEKQNSE
ncbi:hypothetical protein FACS1894137_02400 [Spirochaetia bacterium]|nr:hypothetical protein FACS1894137_02400 [Spirochaetia bacterium]